MLKWKGLNNITEENQKNQVNIRTLLIVALGTNANLRTDINTIYLSNREIYYKLFKDSVYSENKFFDVYSVNFLNTLQQCAGIVQYCYLNNSFQIVESLIKKGFNRIYRYIKEAHHIEYIKIRKLLKNHKNLEEYNQSELVSHIIITVFLCKHYNKFIKEYDWNSLVSILSTYQENILERLNLNREDKQLKTHTGILQDLKEKFSFNEKIINLQNTLRIYIEPEKQLCLKRNNYDINSLDDRYKATVDAYNLGGNASLIGFFNGLTSSLGFFEDMTSISVNEKEINQFLIHFNHSFKVNNVKEKDFDALKIASIFIWSILLEYKLARLNYIPNLEDEIKFGIQNVMKNEIDLTDKMKYLKQKKNTELAIKQQQIELSINRINKLELENKRLHTKLEKLEISKIELQSLRNYVFQEKNPPHILEIDMKEKIELLKQYYLILVGGHTNWIKKMKSIFPNYIYIDEKSLGKSLDFISNNKYTIVFNTATNSHALYEKILKIAAKKSIFYLNGNYNIDLTINTLYLYIKENSS